MTVSLVGPFSKMQDDRLIYKCRPRFEGCNIDVFIGFKNIMYLMEEGILEYFRCNFLSPVDLYKQHGLCIEIVETDADLINAIKIDDQIEAEVKWITPNDGAAGEMVFSVDLFIVGTIKTKATKGTTKVILRKQPHLEHLPVVDGILNEYIRSNIQQVSQTNKVVSEGLQNIVADLKTLPIEEINRSTSYNTFVWKWRIPYFYCHYNHYLQHSGYLRLMEEVVDLFLADRGISLRYMIETRNWVPVVTKAKVDILQDVYLEEEIYTVYTVEEIYARMLYKSRFDCYVKRDGQFVHTATGLITHGYIDIKDWKLVRFDSFTVNALMNRKENENEKK